ncbi:MAG: DUF1232 domain-containing protein [Bacteroidota bacterium]
MNKREKDFYVKLRARMHKWLKSKAGKNHKYANLLMWAPDLFHLLIKLSLDKRVPVDDKILLGAVIVYFISPIDLMPEGLLGPVGYVDDIALAAWAINRIIENAGARVVRDHWAGESDVLAVIKKIVHVSHQMLGGTVWKKLKDLIDSLKRIRL